MKDANLRSLIEQCNRHTGRGNMIAVNQAMLLMIERLAEMIEQRQCSCGSATEPIEFEPEHDQDDAEDPTEIMLEPNENHPIEAPIVVKRKVGRPRRVA